MRPKQVFTSTEVEEIVQIMNNGIQKSEFKEFEVSNVDVDLSDTWGHRGLMQLANPIKGFIPQIMAKSSPSRYGDAGQFFHFKKYSIALDIIQSKNIQVSNLLANDENDYSEFEEFFKRFGPIFRLIPFDYCETLHETQGMISPRNRPIDEDRDNMFILCFTNNFRNVRFWQEYVNNDNGVCLSFRFSNFNPDYYQHRRFYDLRDVAYDSGYRFEFINYINYHLHKKFDRQLLLWGLTRFAQFYKRGIYAWENETRLAFHHNFFKANYNSHALEEILPIQTDSETHRRYINLPLKGNTTMTNPFFDLEIDEVIVGSKITPSDFQIIKTALTANFPSATIWHKGVYDFPNAV